MSDHGVLFPAEGESSQPPRLVAVRTDPQPREEGEIPTDAKKDGVTRRISIPSWDDIMFGRGKKKDEIAFTAEEAVLRDVLSRKDRLRAHVHKIDDIAGLLRLVDEFKIRITV